MRIVIVKLSSIGDVVHTLPAAALLRRSLPEARLAWVVERRAAAILEGCPIIDDLIEIDTRKWRAQWSPATLKDIRESLERLRYGPRNNGDRFADLAIDFQGLLKSALVALASNAPHRLGLDLSDLREKASRLMLNRHAPTAQFQHVIDKNLSLARAAIELLNPALHERRSQSETDEYEFPIALSAEDERFADSIITERAGNYAILNPGGGWPTKLWAPFRFGQLADWLWDTYGLTSLVTYGPGEEVLAQQASQSAKSGRAVVVASTLKQFVSLARRCSLFVGGDTGPLHLAAAAKAPIVGLYGPTSPRRNGPFDPHDLTVGRDLWCRPGCHQRSCWHWECMDIELEDVKVVVSKRLAKVEAGK